MKQIVIIGAGGNSKVIIDLLVTRIQNGEMIEILGVLDDDENKTELMGYPILGPIRNMAELYQKPDLYFVNGIGSNKIRKEVFETYTGAKYYTAIHPSALLGTGVTIGPGSVVMPGAIINTGSVIGKQVLINTGAVVEHDNIIGDFAHLASGTVTAGNVSVGELTMLGTGTRVIQGIKIGKATMIGAGAVVVFDIPSDCTAMGVPARVKER